ncbi:RNA polymerase sigma factor [Clostridium punense]|uniref:RNA polymerase sigma factor n=1 Tax=Clostridium TaxID=1485 RepID=UPI001FA6C475|nr:sigma-70 family RNA polymerase sigma factor [Clostridium sp. BL8]
MNLVTDETLIEKVLAGECQAFEILIKKHQGVIYNYLYKITLSKEDAEDITQEVFIKAYNKLYTFERKANFSTWLFKIAVNTLNDNFKKKKVFELEKEEAMMSIKCSERDIPEEALSLKEKKLEVLKLLEGLTLEQKNAIILKYVRGFSYKEIGKVLGVSEESAKMKVYRARKKLCNTRSSNTIEGSVLSEL